MCVFTSQSRRRCFKAAFLLVSLLAPDGKNEVAEHGVVPQLPVALGHGRRGKVAEQGELVGVDILQQLRQKVFGLVRPNQDRRERLLSLFEGVSQSHAGPHRGSVEGSTQTSSAPFFKQLSDKVLEPLSGTQINYATQK